MLFNYRNFLFCIFACMANGLRRGLLTAYNGSKPSYLITWYSWLTWHDSLPMSQLGPERWIRSWILSVHETWNCSIQVCSTLVVSKLFLVLQTCSVQWTALGSTVTQKAPETGWFHMKSNRSPRIEILIPFWLGHDLYRTMAPFIRSNLFRHKGFVFGLNVWSHLGWDTLIAFVECFSSLLSRSIYSCCLLSFSLVLHCIHHLSIIV